MAHYSKILTWFEREGTSINMTPEVELLVTDWFRRVRESQRVHYECGTYYSRSNYLIGVPTVIITAGVGTAVFASFDKGAVGAPRIILGLVSIAGAVLASLQTFLAFGQRADRHRFTGSRYGAIRRSLEFRKTFPPKDDEGFRIELEKIKKEWTNSRKVRLMFRPG